jgi:hypothetical protein
VSKPLLPIQLTGTDGVSVTINPAAVEFRDGAVGWAAMLTEVTSPEQQASAVDSMRDLKEIERDVEAARKAVKAPVLEFGRQIDARATEFLEPVIAHGRRLNALVTHYQDEQRRAAAAEQARLAEEARKVEAERRRVDEENRKAAEAARLANLPPPAPVAPPPPVVMTAPAVVEAPKPEGLIAREVWEFEVVDIAALYATNPGLCKIEPRTAEINRMISRGFREIPGLRIFSQLKTGVRL